MDDLDVLKFDDSAAVAVVLSWYLVKKMLTDVLYIKGCYEIRVAEKKEMVVSRLRVESNGE